MQRITYLWNLELPLGLYLENAKTILYETNPCPFTAQDVEERLLGTTEFTPKSAIVCLFPYYVEHNGPSNLSRYTWGTDYHLVINEYLENLLKNYKNESFSSVFYTL